MHQFNLNFTEGSRIIKYRSCLKRGIIHKILLGYGPFLRRFWLNCGLRSITVEGMQQKIMSPWLSIKSFPPSGSFCCLLIIFANLLYPCHLLIIFTNLLEQYQARQTLVRSEFTPFDTDSFHERIFEKVNFEKSQQTKIEA